MMTKTILVLSLLLFGCIPQRNLLESTGDDVGCEVTHAEEKARDYFGGFESLYTIATAPLDKILPFCGGSACLVGYRIYLAYPDTHEYICQKILHELGHLILGEKEGNMDYEHKNTDFFGNAEKEIRGYISYACEAVRTENLCGLDGELL